MKIMNELQNTQISQNEQKDYYVGFCEDIEEYILVVNVFWVSMYNRYYRITKEDYDLFTKNSEEFDKKFEWELSCDSNYCFTDRFIGSDSLRDYDGMPNFQNVFPTKDNPFKGYGYEDGVLYARICFDDNEIFVAPIIAIPREDGKYDYPLRNISQLLTDSQDYGICFIYPED